MKKLISKIKNRISNRGSGIVLVIVALGFVGILAGALLTAVASVYRLKIYDYNAKSNFYYLEQAMDEIYAGVGTKTMSDMQQAYQDTREKIIYYDVKSNTYKNIGNSAANKMFKDNFMSRIAKQSFYNLKYKDDGSLDTTDGLIKELQGLYSNDTIELVPENIKVIKLDENGKTYTGATGQALAKVVIKNVTLKRTAKYSRSAAKGTFTQTISTDIEINRPDFDVQFNSNNLDIDNLFSYCMIADSGVEINENQGSKLTINGNIYAASDFYNKTYNKYDDTSAALINQDKFQLTRTTDDGEDASVEYRMDVVSNKRYGSNDVSSLRNYNQYLKDTSNSYLYDGDNERSKYSGLYINGANVSILANYVIVPGSLSVMNSGELSLYGRNGTQIGESNVWVDELVMGGYVPKGLSSTTNTYSEPRGANAFLDANLYVKDDTQIESNNANLKLTGGYYGYSNSNTSDDRVFVPTTKKDNRGRYIYQQSVLDSKGNTVVENRGHYNSSSIIVNSENATLDMSTLDTLYIAGRSYVELSHQKNGSSNVKKDIKYDDDGNATTDVTYKVDEEKNSYEYDSNVDDYRTGESVSIKSSQLAYIPEKQPFAVDENGDEVAEPTDSPKNYDHYQCSISSKLGNAYLFQKYFGKGVLDETVTYIPVIYSKDTVNNTDTTTSEKIMYYIDFDYVAANDLYDTSKFDIKTDANKGTYGDYLKKCFIQDYFDYLDYVDDFKDNNLINIPDSVDQDILAGEEIKAILNQVTYYEDHLAGEIAIPDMNSNNVHTYTSGVVTYTGQKDNATNSNVIFKVNEKNQYVDVNSTVQTVNFKVITAKNSVIDSTLEGSTVKAFNIGSDSEGNSVLVNNTTNFSNEYQKHYNYVKWALMDLEGTSDEAAIVDSIVSKNGEGCITPLNRYMNFDNIKDEDALMNFGTNDTTARATEINPSNLDLGTYKVWVSDDKDNDGLSIECSSEDNNSLTGIIISKGDVYFKTQAEIKADHPTWSNEKCKEAVCNNFNGIIITGGKIYVNNNVTSINATDLCRNIINSCLTKASQAGTKESDEVSSDEALKLQQEGAKAIRVLSLFKAYEKDAKAAEEAARKALSTTSTEEEDNKEKENADSPLSISNIDYSDVVRYNNWMRNVD